MRKYLIVLLAGLCILLPLSIAHATVYTFIPNPPDLNGLTHQDAYRWGINWSVPQGEHIVGASISINQINDWQVESDDILYIDLLDTNKHQLGLKTYLDSENPSDYFSGKYNGIPLTTFSDVNDSWITVTKYKTVYTYELKKVKGKWKLVKVAHQVSYDVQEQVNPAQDFYYAFDPDQLNTLNLYAKDGYFGLGFDPDCHYDNNGITFRIVTATPEPATMSLFGLGLAGLGLIKRRRTI